MLIYKENRFKQYSQVWYNIWLIPGLYLTSGHIWPFWGRVYRLPLLQTRLFFWMCIERLDFRRTRSLYV